MIDQIELKNGIKLVHRQVDSLVSHCALFINVGTRDELAREDGLAHFLEHVIFKGTSNRKAYHILNRLESVGGELNAFTTKEITCIYATFLNEFYDRAFELISDITFNSTFPQKELEKEKDIIIEEIYSYKDSPYDLIYDEFEEQIFKGHSLGRNILGDPESVKKITKEEVLAFVNRNYNTDQMVLSSVGNHDLKKAEKIANKYFGSAKERLDKVTREPLNKYQTFNILKEKSTYQTHSMLGSRAYSRGHEKRLALVLLNNFLGGPGLNSRLNLMVREKYGYAYQIESFYHHYADTGLWGIYMGTANDTFAKAKDLVMKELKDLREKKLGSSQLKMAKTQLIGQIAINFESNLNKMLSMGRSYIMEKKIDTLKSINRRIELISAEELIEVANEVFAPENISTLIYKSK